MSLLWKDLGSSRMKNTFKITTAIVIPKCGNRHWADEGRQPGNRSANVSMISWRAERPQRRSLLPIARGTARGAKNLSSAKGRSQCTNTHNHLLPGVILEAVREFRGSLHIFTLLIYIFLMYFSYTFPLPEIWLRSRCFVPTRCDYIVWFGVKFFISWWSWIHLNKPSASWAPTTIKLLKGLNVFRYSSLSGLWWLNFNKLSLNYKNVFIKILQLHSETGDPPFHSSLAVPKISSLH